jgi:hypothetical protein
MYYGRYKIMVILFEIVKKAILVLNFQGFISTIESSVKIFENAKKRYSSNLRVSAINLGAEKLRMIII